MYNGIKKLVCCEKLRNWSKEQLNRDRSLIINLDESLETEEAEDDQALMRTSSTERNKRTSHLWNKIEFQTYNMSMGENVNPEIIQENEHEQKRLSELLDEIKVTAREQEKVERQEEMAPLFLFLSSALNVELVYVILESISKFGLLCFVKNGFTKEQMKEFQ